VSCIFFEDCKTNYGKAQTVVFLNLCISDIITVFSARTKSWFFSRKPALALFLAFIFAVTATSMVSTLVSFGGMEPISAYSMGIIWIYVLIWFVIRDALKLIAYKLIEKYKIVDRTAYLDLVKAKPKDRLGMSGIRKFSQDIREVGRRRGESVDVYFEADVQEKLVPGGRSAPLAEEKKVHFVDL